jgi:hypothetical protein
MRMLISTKRTHNIVIGEIRTMKTEVEEALKEIQPREPSRSS